MNISWIYEEYIMNISWIYHEYIMNISLNYNQQIAKTGHFPWVFPTTSGRMLPPSGASTPAPEETCPSCGNAPASDVMPENVDLMKFEWNIELHLSQNTKVFWKNTFLDAQKGTVWGLKPQILAYSCWYFPVFCCCRWLLVINCSFWNEQM